MALAELLYSAMLSTSSPMAVGASSVGGLHQRAALDQQFLEQGLAAGVRPPLEGNDLLILAAHILPVGDRSGVDVLAAAAGSGSVTGLSSLTMNTSASTANGLLLQRVTVSLQLLLDGFRGLVGDDQH